MEENKSNHLSSSHVETKIEEFIVQNIENGKKWKNERKPIINGIEYNFDFYDLEQKIMIEIYAGLPNVKGKVSPGPIRKIMRDCFKMLSAIAIKKSESDWNLNEKWQMTLIFIDKIVMDRFDYNNFSWEAKAIRQFGIKIKFYDLEKYNPSLMQELLKTKPGQRIGNIKK